MADVQDILKVPIYINGGKGKPTNKLGERELYLNLSSAHLYAGGIGSTDYSLIRAGYADCLQGSGVEINAPYGSGTPLFKLGELTYNFSNNKFVGSAPGAYSVDGANLTNVTKLVLSNSCYGSTLPSSGEQGQLFFKIG